MNAKKNPRHDLEGKRATIFAIGLLAAGSFTLAAFTYTSPLAVEEAKIAADHSPVDYYVEAETKEQPKEEPVVETQQQEQPEEVTIDLVSDVTEDINRTESSHDKVESGGSAGILPIKSGDFDVTIVIPDVKPDIVDFPDQEAKWIGGEKQMFEYIHKHMEYPDIAVEGREEGKVWVTFVVETDGTISSISTQGDAHRSLHAEARRVVKSFPKWEPGSVGGLNVRTRVRLPINFVLAD